MELKIKKSVATLLAHIIKIDDRDIDKEAPLFCKLMGNSFDCSEEEAKDFLTTIVKEDYDLDKHLDIINDALCHDRLSKMHLLEQVNHIIYSDKITPRDYEEFEKIKDRLFICKNKDKDEI
ncbi:hypothetical protein MNB_SV-9-1020 [hydrothermal vent metagenome]|uniref:Co-chaperone DjlA N-terminal domain-containing protein n=1 Tax=hydrothermal vent metagenome TaxID=652676 RepID=A0A1W1BDQ9_9ZZZZ